MFLYWEVILKSHTVMKTEKYVQLVVGFKAHIKSFASLYSSNETMNKLGIQYHDKNRYIDKWEGLESSHL